MKFGASPLGRVCMRMCVCVCMPMHVCVCPCICMCVCALSEHHLILWLHDCKWRVGCVCLGGSDLLLPLQTTLCQRWWVCHTQTHTHTMILPIFLFFFPHLKYIFNDFLKVNSYFFIWYCTCFNAILPNHPPSLSHRVQKTVLYICVSFAVLHTELSLPSF